MTPGPEKVRPFTSKLGFKLALLLAAILLPLTLISVFKSMSVAEEVRFRSESALKGEMMAAAAPTLGAIQTAAGAANVLALTIGAVLDDEAACAEVMRKVHESEAIYALVGFIPLDGIMRCSSHGVPVDFSGYRFFEDEIEKKAPALSVNRIAPVAKTSVLGVSHPVLDSAGDFRGFVYLSLPHRTLERREGSERPLQLMTFDRDGKLLTASVDFSEALSYLPVGKALTELTAHQLRAFSAPSVGQGNRVFAILPLVPDELFAIGSWPSVEITSVDDSVLSVPIVLPTLMWLASLTVAWLGVERLVTRHIRKLSNSIKSFASGIRMVGDISVKGAPLEIREMAEAYEQMTDTILRDEAEMEDTVHQKEVLLREVHHRVKNNLQLIASIMNMHMRKARTPETRELLKGLQSRVMSLATIHRELYQTSGVTDVHAEELIGTIGRQTVAVASADGRRFKLLLDIDDIRMIPDQAVPLALLVAEAVMNAVKYAAATAEPEIELALKRDGLEDVTLRVVNATTAVMAGENMNAQDTTGGLGNELMEAFAMQIGGKLVQKIVDEKHTLTVTFHLNPLADAEARNESKATVTA